jgi:hypothetical protein
VTHFHLRTVQLFYLYLNRLPLPLPNSTPQKQKCFPSPKKWAWSEQTFWRRTSFSSWTWLVLWYSASKFRIRGTGAQS